MIFEWDPQKARSNASKHDVSFDEASTVFGDPLADSYDDPDHSKSERRFIIIGHSDKNRLLFVSHTSNEKVVRIISAREVTSGERKEYEEE